MGAAKGKKLNYWSKHKKLASIKKMDNAKEWNKSSTLKEQERERKKKEMEPVVNANKQQISSSMFFSENLSLGPPYRILVDTNFINFSVMNKLDVIKAATDCLFAKCDICITDCVIGELEKLGDRFRVALRIAKDPRFIRLKCHHRGVYADDCICKRVESSPVYVVATCDRDLKRRVRKLPGVPIMSIKNRQYYVERLPEADTLGVPKSSSKR